MSRRAAWAEPDDGRGENGPHSGGGEQIDPYCSTIRGGGCKKEKIMKIISLSKTHVIIRGQLFTITINSDGFVVTLHLQTLN